ncbi:MAG: hypothetical protein HOV80_02755 [Polyangiaceae bacterium]|nr:hypothetical protein [Polyangiaceae bacterium]
MSRDDKETLEQQVGLLAREEASDAWSDPAWESMARGELSDAEVAALLERAGDDAPEALAVFTPLGAGFERSVVDALVGGAEAGRENDGVPPAAEEPPPAVARLSEERRKRRRSLLSIGGGLAVAAAVMLFVVTRSETNGAAGLPDYEMSLRGGSKDVRGDEPATSTALRPGDLVSVQLRPVSRTKGPLAVQVFLVTSSSALRLEAKIDTAEGGFVRAEAKLPEAIEGDGPAEIAVVVGRPAAVERSWGRDDLLGSAQRPNGEVEVLRHAVRLRRDP